MLSQIPKPLSSSFPNPSIPIPIPIPNPTSSSLRFSTPSPSLSLTHLPLRRRRSPILAMASSSDLPNAVVSGVDDSELDRFAAVANKVADASGEVIRKYFRQKFDILDKADSSPVTIADQTAEEHMISVISENFPSHAVYGEENGWRCKETSADYVWVLDPIDGTKSFITDSWYNRSAYFKRKMAWVKWKKDYIKWKSSVDPQVYKSCTGLSVHYKSTSVQSRSRGGIYSRQK